MSTSQSPEEDGSRGTPRAGAAEPAAAPPGAPATGGSLPSRRTWVLAATGGLALLGGFGLWLSRQHAAEQAMDPALRSLWPLKFATPDGATLAMARFTGRPLLLNFWATWCPPCIEEMPSMIRLNDKLAKDPRFVLLAVSADESWEPVRKFFGEQAPRFTVLLDAKGELARKYGTTMFPETYVVKGGKIVGFIEGPRKWDEWYAEQYLRELLRTP